MNTRLRHAPPARPRRASSRKESRMNASTGMSSPSSSTTPGGFAGDVFGQQPPETDRVLPSLIQDTSNVPDRSEEHPPEPQPPMRPPSPVSSLKTTKQPTPTPHP